ncbi:MAG: ABC transporter permease [Saccharothrix sp.]|nr:ABC transporter permease [Saccharothrix sp.]
MTGAARWLLRRVAHVVVVLGGAATLSFIALELIPGDPARVLVGGAPATPQALALIRHEMGLDLPLPVRFLRHLDRLAHFDLGRSYQLQKPVAQVVGEQLWPTAQLALAASALALAATLLVTTTTAGRSRVVRAACQAFELLAASMPTFWTGILLLSVFSFGLRWFPVSAAHPAGLVLPAVALALPVTGVLCQVLREATEEVLVQPFVTTARTRGVTEWAVRTRHVLRHTLVPLVTMSGWTLGTLLGGAVVVETVFARPGLGRVTLAAVNGRDFPVVTAVVMLSALVFVVINLVTDALYLVVDPRLRGA